MSYLSIWSLFYCIVKDVIKEMTQRVRVRETTVGRYGRRKRCWDRRRRGERTSVPRGLLDPVSEFHGVETNWHLGLTTGAERHPPSVPTEDHHYYHNHCHHHYHQRIHTILSPSLTRKRRHQHSPFILSLTSNRCPKHPPSHSSEDSNAWRFVSELNIFSVTQRRHLDKPDVILDER